MQRKIFLIRSFNISTRIEAFGERKLAPRQNVCMSIIIIIIIIIISAAAAAANLFQAARPISINKSQNT